MAAPIIRSEKELLSEIETAYILGVQPNTLAIWRSTRRHDLPFVKVGRLVRYRMRDIAAWLQRRTVNPAPGESR